MNRPWQTTPKTDRSRQKQKIAINDFLDWTSLPEQVKNLFDNVINNIIVIIDRLKAWENNWNFAVPRLTAFGVEWGPRNNYRNSIPMTSHKQDGSWFWLVEANFPCGTTNQLCNPQKSFGGETSGHITKC